jgi:hypothetical protein
MRRRRLIWGLEVSGRRESVESPRRRRVGQAALGAGPPLATGSVREIIVNILARHGFQTNTEKFELGRVADGITITGLRRNQRGNLDVRQEYAIEVEQQLTDVTLLQNGSQWDAHRLYYTSSQIRGRIEFIRWVNLSRGEGLMRQFRKVNWEAVEKAANEQRLVIAKKRLVKKSLEFDSNPA